MKNVFKAALVGGILAFFWSVCSWTLFPWHVRCFEQFTNEKEVALVLQKNAPKRGIYLIPPYEFDEAQAKSFKFQKTANGDQAADNEQDTTPQVVPTPAPTPTPTPAPQATEPAPVQPEATPPSKQEMADKMNQEEKLNEELLAFCSVVPSGHSIKSYKRLIESFGIQLISAFVVALIVKMASIRNYFLAVLFTAFLGLGAGIIVYLPMINWFGFSWDFAVISTLDLGAAWLLAGIGMSIWTTAKKKHVISLK